MTDTSVASETLRQLGGRRFMAMTGARDPLASDDYTLSFQLPAGMAKNRARKVMVELTPMDVYRVSFWSFDRKAMELTLISCHEDIYCDALVACFERETGLYTRLGTSR